MPFKIVRNDIVNMRVDAIVNTANPQPVIGAGTDAAIHAKAGPGLLEARKKIGQIPPGSCAVTDACGLDARYVLHTVGPVWVDGSRNEETLLRQCYTAALTMAAELGCESVAFPLMGAGSYGFPGDKALAVAMEAIGAFLLKQELQVYLVVFNREAFTLSRKLFTSVKSYIDENYVRDRLREEYAADFSRRYPAPRRREEGDCSAVLKKAALPVAAAEPMASGLEQMLAREDAGFSETLLRLIDGTGKKDSEIYKKANISKQHFSKIRNNPHYQPTKATALAFAIALELDLEQTRDLIGRAGFALTNSSKFDLIIMYFIEKRNYNIVQINITLYEFDQMLLGA